MNLLNGIIRIHLPDYICRLLFQFGKHIHGFCHKIHIFFTWLNSGTGKQVFIVFSLLGF